MRDLKNHLWTLPFIGIIICFTSLLTPTAFFENTFWNHLIYNWLWGYFYEKLPSDVVIRRFYNDPLQLFSSIFATIIIIVCLLIIITSFYKNRDKLKSGIINPFTSILPSIFIIIIMSIWMITMEIAELQLYGISFWLRYLPNFGLIGMFLGAGIIICGFLLIKKLTAEKMSVKTQTSKN